MELILCNRLMFAYLLAMIGLWLRICALSNHGVGSKNNPGLLPFTMICLTKFTDSASVISVTNTTTSPMTPCVFSTAVNPCAPIYNIYAYCVVTGCFLNGKGGL